LVAKEHLIGHFFELRKAGIVSARRRFRSHRLDYGRRVPLGLALQSLLEQGDEVLQRRNWARAIAGVRIADRCCCEICEPLFWPRLGDY
jgi:hypothetical protein